MPSLGTHMFKRNAISAALVLGALGLFVLPANAQITTSTDLDGRRLFINAEPPVRVTLSAYKRTNIFMPPENPFVGRSQPAVTISRDGVEKLVREAADRHRVDAALIRAVIETESNWNPIALSNKGAGGLMQLIPTTARRFGVNDVFNPQQNIDGGVHYLKILLDRYNGNLDLALAAYNAGEGAVDRARGVPSYRETRNYVQKVQNAYFRPGSGRLNGEWSLRRPIRRDLDASGRIIFNND